jgi:cellulose synthase/poly-beta-1,6-N-acetylglucosamine synthase-like glycosyltransferase
MLSLLSQVSLLVLALPAGLAAAYLLALTALSARVPEPRPKSRQLRFDVIVPAHNEAAVITRTIASLRRIDWPDDRFRIVVCADNCTDDTADRARAAGARVLERRDTSQRGKGYALDFAFKASRAAGFADAVVVIDADTEVSRNLLEAIAARLERGVEAVQVHYGVLNPMASWRTRLFTIATGSVHILRSRARERLGLSCGIRGTGWCVTHRLLEAVPYRAFSLTEDVEYGIALGLAGYRVAYADEADANPEMVPDERSARTQRQRWERGRFQLIRSQTGLLLRAAVQRRSALCLDLAIDLMVLPIAYVALNIGLLLALAAVTSLWLPGMRPWLWLGTACAAILVCYVLRGWQLSQVGLRGLLSLAGAPAFLLWKLIVLLGGRKSNEWQRTKREGQAE